MQCLPSICRRTSNDFIAGNGSFNNPDRIETGRAVRTTTTKEWKDDYKSKAASENVSRDMARLWNSAP